MTHVRVPGLLRRLDHVYEDFQTFLPSGWVTVKKKKTKAQKNKREEPTYVKIRTLWASSWGYSIESRQGNRGATHHACVQLNTQALRQSTRSQQQHSASIMHTVRLQGGQQKINVCLGKVGSTVLPRPGPPAKKPCRHGRRTAVLHDPPVGCYKVCT